MFDQFKVGQTIKAFDFKPMSDREDQYVVGKITEIVEYPVTGYRVNVEEDSVFKKNPRPEVIVPMKVMFMEYDTRVTLVE